MPDDLTGLTNPAKPLRKTSRTVWVPDPVTAIPQAIAQYSTPSQTTAPTYSSLSEALTTSGYFPDRWIESDNGEIIYLPRGEYTYGR